MNTIIFIWSLILTGFVLLIALTVRNIVKAVTGAKRKNRPTFRHEVKRGLIERKVISRY